MRPTGFSLLLCSLVAPLAAQQTVALPHDTGNLTVPTNWTVLGAEELAADARDSDPTSEPGRALLLGTIRFLNESERTSDSLLLHQPGSSPGQVRTITTHSCEQSGTAEQVQSEEFAEELRGGFEDAFGSGETKVVFQGKKTLELFPVGSLSLLFRTETKGNAFMTECVVVPAGERLQVFQIMFAPDDLDAATTTHGVISTFDGAREAEDNVTRNMILGGVAGAVAGMCAALVSRRRQRRLLVERAETPAAERETGEQGD